jgi:uncharacterized membrane protein
MGLVIRLFLLSAVVFAIVYGVTRAMRASAHSKEARRIAYEVEKLHEAIARGRMTPAEYAAIADRIRSDCKRIGIAPPLDLPPHLPPSSGDN